MIKEFWHDNYAKAKILWFEYVLYKYYCFAIKYEIKHLRNMYMEFIQMFESRYTLLLFLKGKPL